MEIMRWILIWFAGSVLLGLVIGQIIRAGRQVGGPELGYDDLP